MLPGRYLLVFAAVVWGMKSAPVHAETIEVTISNLVFSPAELKAKVGDTIVWTNKDIVTHTATASDGWDVIILENTSASQLLKKPGLVEYYCRFHPSMKGRITIVRE